MSCHSERPATPQSHTINNTSNFETAWLGVFIPGIEGPLRLYYRGDGLHRALLGSPDCGTIDTRCVGLRWKWIILRRKTEKTR